MTLAMLGGIVKVPPYSGYIFTTPYSSSKLYLATRPIGPANDWSHIIAYEKGKILGVVKRNPLFFHSISCKNNGFLFTTSNIS